MNESEFRYQDNTVHPRQAEILRNNYNLFMNRAWRSNDGEYRSACAVAACEAANEYYKLTGKEIDQ